MEKIISVLVVLIIIGVLMYIVHKAARCKRCGGKMQFDGYKNFECIDCGHTS